MPDLMMPGCHNVRFSQTAGASSLSKAQEFAGKFGMSVCIKTEEVMMNG
jgi:hypothetical protein